MGALERISTAHELFRSQSAERRSTVQAAIDEDNRANPEVYAIHEVKVTAALTPVATVSALVGCLTPTHGLPFLVTASTLLIALNLKKLLFLRRLKKGVAFTGGREKTIALGELQAEPVSKVMD